MEVENKQMQAALRNCFFNQRITSLWNKLPASVVPVNSSKKRLYDWRNVEL